MNGLVRSVFSVTELKGEKAHSVIAWDLPVVGGLTKIDAKRHFFVLLW